MSVDVTGTLTRDDIRSYHDEGYLIVRDVLSSSEAEDLRGIVQAQSRINSFPPSLKYPTPGKYTVSGNFMSEPGLAPIAEHPTVVDAVEAVLGNRAYLTAYVAYLRSPGDKGSGPHCDYKRWRPVGSSMNWCFAIIPLTDFTAEYGPLLVSPGSHKLSPVIDPGARILDVARPDRDALPAFVDPDLRAGDLLLMHMHTWHEAPAGTTSEDRVGIFNKYCAVDAPPAAGYYPYDSAARDALTDTGKRLIPVCYDEPLATTRLLVERERSGESEYLVLNDDQGTRLPGGEGWEEEKVGWDVGARIGSLQDLVRDQVGHEIPWMSWIDDVPEGGGLCRLYGYVADEDFALPDSGAWLSRDAFETALGHDGSLSAALDTWHDADFVRGRGKAIRQSKEQFE